jgi:hypothetical protein
VPVHLVEDESPGSSVAGLVERFGESAAAILDAVIANRRVLFLGAAGSPAGDVCEAALSACTMAAGAGGAMRVLARCWPYAALPSLDALLATDGFVAGCLNPIFEAHPEWWDCLCWYASLSHARD